MGKKFAMSVMGYAIVTVIILGIVMIASAPMLINSTKEKKTPEPVQQSSEEKMFSENSSDLRRVEEYLSSRIDELEHRQSNNNESNTVRDKYVCTIEGTLDDDGNVVPRDTFEQTDKIVFVCEYRH